MRLRFGLLACVVLGASQAMAQIEVNTGNVTVNVKYNGQPLPGGCFLYFTSAIGGFGCGSSYSNVLIGNYTLTEAHGYPFTPIPFTISAGQTTVVNVETSGFVGVVTGTVSLNGQPGTGLQVRTNHEDGYSGTDNTGRFRFIALAGPGTGTVGNGLATFNFNAVAGSEIDVGSIGVTTGNVTVNVKYNGQPLPGGCFLYFSSAIGGFGCGSSYSNVLTGNYTLTEAHGYPFTPMPFTITAGQTTVLNIETSGFVGIITGTVSLNGQPGVGLQVRTNHEDGYSGTDNTGRFRFIALAGSGTGTVGNGLATFNFNAVAGSEIDVGSIGVTTGNVTVNVKYNGQPLPGGCFLYFSSQLGGFGCGSSYSNVLTGNYTLTEAHGYPFTPMPFTVSAGQTTVVNVETSGFVGIITGTVSLNGQPGVGLQVRTNHEDGYSGTDNTGRFRFIALAGPGIGTVGNGLATFNFNAVAGQIRDLGSIGATSLFGSIVNKPGSVPNKQWNIRVANTGSNAAANTKLDSLTLTQTFGSTCTPTITSTFPINLGLLTAGSSADTSVSINFNTCAANSRFTAVINSSANSGAVTNSRSITNQQP